LFNAARTAPTLELPITQMRRGADIETPGLRFGYRSIRGKC